MKWSYSIKNKLAAAFLLFVVLCLVLLNNFHERSNSSEINRAMTAIYKDRLLVEGYIYSYSEHLHQIIELIERSPLDARGKQLEMQHHFAAMQELSRNYLQTELTESERMNFTRFTTLLGHLERNAGLEQFDAGALHARDALSVLHTLSTIQLNEAGTEMHRAEKIFSSTTISLQFEMALLVVIIVLIQILVFASKTLKNPVSDAPADLN